MSEWSGLLEAAAKASPWLSAAIAVMLLAKPLVAIWMVLKLAPPNPDMEVRVKAGSFEIEFRRRLSELDDEDATQAEASSSRAAVTEAPVRDPQPSAEESAAAVDPPRATDTISQ
ncbi:hypothetical protein [Lentzea sp. CA-135723]|uniref:hypothetical protein n=1 Tax=Lentzea sp. CA-135723 TaxID=3239950 RepID=UPI003D8E3209